MIKRDGKRRNKFITLMLSTIIFSLVALAGSSAAYAADDEPDKSLEGDWCGIYSNVELGTFPGSRDLNTNIKNKKQTVAVSPYDRFGNHLMFTYYGGEKKLSIGLTDNLYRDLISKNEESKIDMSTFFNISKSGLQDVVYSGRTPVISEEDYQAGGKDPRRAAYTCVPGVNGGDVAVGNLYMGMANNIQQIVSALIDSENFIAWAADTIADAVSPLSGMLWFLLGIAMVGFMIWLLNSIWRFVRGKISGKEAIKGIGAVFLALGLFAAFVINPQLITKIISNTATSVQSLTKESMNNSTTVKFCKSGITDNVYSCNIFYSTIYKDWAEAEGFNELKISEETLNIVGLPSVPLGGNQVWQSWDVLTYSSMSRFHIQDVNPETLEKGSWANTLPLNGNFHIDLVRSYDARMGIGQSSGDQADMMSVPGHPIDYHDRTPAGLWMFFKSITLAPIAYVAILKAWALLSMLATFVKMISDSIRTVLRPADTRLTRPLKSLWDNFKLYLFTTIQIYILVMMYNFMSEGATIFLWIIFSWAIAIIKPKMVAEQYKKAKVKLRQFNSRALVRGK